MRTLAARSIPFHPSPELDAAFTCQLCHPTPGGALAIQPMAKGANQLYSELSETYVEPGPRG